MVRWACLILLATLGLAACASRGPYSASGKPAGLFPDTGIAPRAANRRVAILLPLSGPLARVGQQMLQAAELVLATPGSPSFHAIDTNGTPAGAAAAASQAIAGHAGILLGPLTSAATAAAATVARRAGVPMLAFTNDDAEAQPGVWVLGITPGQQVRRLMAALQERGKTRLAALLPENAYGTAMQQAAERAAAAASAPPPVVQTYGTGMSALTATVRSVSDYADRRGPIEAKIRAARKLDTAAGRARMHALNARPIPPPPFDALLLAATGTPLQEIAALLPYYDIHPAQVQIMGPILWQDPRSRKGAPLAGAWYAAPDPTARQQFANAYAVRYGTQPPSLADLAFDAAGLARVLAEGPGYTEAALTNPAGFMGADGILALRPNGTVQRGLAVMVIGPDQTASVLEPGVTTLARPGA